MSNKHLSNVSREIAEPRESETSSLSKIGNEYNWYVAWKHGLVPTNIKHGFSQKDTSGRSYSANQKLPVILSVILFMFCTFVFAGMELWITAVINALQEKTGTFPEPGSILSSINSEAFGKVITVSSSAVTAIVIWQLVIRTLEIRVKDEIAKLEKVKVTFLNRCSNFIEQYRLWCGGEKEKYNSVSSNENSPKRTWCSGNGELKSLKSHLDSYTSRVSQVKTSEALIFVVVIFSSSAALMLWAVSEMLPSDSCENGCALNVTPIWVVIPLILLHALVFLVVQHDVAKYRQVLKNAGLGDNSIQSLKYLLSRIEFGSKNSVTPTPGPIRMFKDSHRLRIFNVVTLAAIAIKCFDQIDSRYGTPYAQAMLTLSYVVIGLVFPCIVFCSFALDGSFVRFKINFQGRRNWPRVVIMLFCLSFNLIGPLGCVLIIHDATDLLWYPWFNPVVSLLAFWILCDLVLWAFSKKVSASVSAILTDLELAASQELTAVRCSGDPQRLSRFGHKKLYFGETSTPGTA